MKKNIGSKLLSKAGESIGEVLIALLVSASGLMILAGMISAAVNMITKTKNSVNEYVAGESAIVMQESGGTQYAACIKEGIATVRLTEDSGENIGIICYSDTAIGGRAVVAYKVKDNAS